MQTPLAMLIRETPVATGRHPVLSVLGKELAVDMLLNDAWSLDDARVAYLCDCAALWLNGDCECDHEPPYIAATEIILACIESMATSRPDWDSQEFHAACHSRYAGPQAKLWGHAPSQEWTQLSPSVRRLYDLGRVW